MSTHKHFDRICCAVLALTLILCVFISCGESLGIKKVSEEAGYEGRLFDISRVHTVDIVMDDAEKFFENCKDEEYSQCAVAIDSEAYRNIAIRAKGNTSLTQVEAYGNDRYSFKLEFDRYDSSKSYYGLDKLCLNNIIQDNTYMKDFICYRMMAEEGVASPLCSYAYVTINGEERGLYLAVEGVEEAFLRRNFGADYGELYKPESEENGQNQPPDGEGGAFRGGFSEKAPDGRQGRLNVDANNGNANDGGMNDELKDELKDGASGRMNIGERDELNIGGSGADDVLLKYIDDDAESYKNIFDNAKTDVTTGDKARLIEALKVMSGESAENAVDAEAVIRYFAAHNFVLNFDSYTGSMIHNYYLYEKDGRLQMIPWDYNLAFGGFGSGADATALVNYPIDSPVSGGSIQDRPMLSWIFDDGEYESLYHSCLSELISEWFDGGLFERTVEGAFELIAPYVEKDPTKFCSYEEFEAGVSTLKEFCALRAESVKAQLEGIIGSTSDTQDEGELIDAGDIKISDMGSMGAFENGRTEMPFGGAGESEDGAPPDFPEGEDGGSGAVILTVLSVSALAFGLCFAAFYRRRG